MCPCGWRPRPFQLVMCNDPNYGPFYCPDCNKVLPIESGRALQLYAKAEHARRMAREIAEKKGGDA